ncbi:uncharacterized protein LOC131944146 [Physella acuta]|uniref:uncharacterized protein LOC131944146 n=1 Tax=Physella acuta TaxID=109671 RepID=UPI0027DD6977|nr:uncharacterized protein LOC131944146 [Physella acuta]XP_059160646.1 uncharacterized protein LOC131944146 [Physella acuta]
MSGYLILILLCAVLRQTAAQALCRNHYCISDATCVNNNTCRCNNPPFSRGDGRFACYRQNTVDAEVRNDPTLTTFNQETVNFPYPCRYLLSHVKQEFKLYGTVVGYCEFQVHAFNARDFGKFYAEGFEVAVKVTYNGVYGFSSTTWGDTSGVTTKENFNSYAPNGPFNDPYSGASRNVPASGGVLIKTFYNTVNQQYVFQADQCGFKLTFTPYDKVARIRSPRIPGISLAINCAHHPQWLSNWQVMGLAPTSQGGKLIAAIQAMYPTLNPSNAMLQRAFTRGVVQNQPGASQKCVSLGTSLNSCSNTSLTNLYNSAGWIFTTPTFVRCLSANDPSSDAVLQLFQLLSDFFCNGTCVKAQVQTLIGSCSPNPPANLISLLALLC